MHQALVWLLSPTLAYIDKSKRSLSKKPKTDLLRRWNRDFVLVAASTLAFYVTAEYFTTPSVLRWVFLPTACVAFSRINEIVIAFYRDVISWVDATQDRGTEFEPIDRIHAVMLSYLEVTVNFSLIYIVLNSWICAFTGSGVKSVFDALYFSGVTITTTGYGDIQPVGVVRFVAVYEALAGFVLLVIAFAVYASGERARRIKMALESGSDMDVVLVKRPGGAAGDPGESDPSH